MEKWNAAKSWGADLVRSAKKAAIVSLWSPLVFWHSRRNLISFKEFLWLIKQGQFSTYILKYRKYIQLHDRDYLGASHPIIVYQMLKVGSKTVCKSLEPVLKYPILHRHFLFRENADAFISALPLGDASEYRAGYLAKITYTDTLRGQRKQPHWKVVALVRDPVARNISFFFNIIHRFQKNLSARESQKSLQEQVSHLLTLFEKQQTTYHYDELLATWFDVELNRAFGIDVFRSDFPKDRGYKIYSGPKADVLLVRLESLNACYQEAFQEFLGVRVPLLSNSNRSEDKGYDDIYSQFKHAVTFPSDYLDRLYSLKYVRHCYTEEEIDGFKAKWKRSTDHSG